MQTADGEIVDVLRARKVLQHVLAEVARTDARRPGAGAVEEGVCRAREQHLAAVPGARDACRTVNVDADVGPAAELPLPRMQAHPDLDPDVVRPALRREPSLGLDRGGHCRPGAAEDHEEGVALGTDFDAAVLLPRLARDLSVPFQ
jgi:hypothetical protein